MTYRNTEEALRAKNLVLEEQMKLIEVKTQQLSQQRKKERQKELKASFKRWGSRLGYFTFVAFVFSVLWVSVLKIKEDSNKTTQENKAEHQRKLASLRAHVPQNIDHNKWVWCLDHCARYGTKGPHDFPIVEGVVTDTFVDYAGEYPIFRISVMGPWLNAEGAYYASYVVGNMDTDPPRTRLNVGTMVRISDIGRSEGLRVYTFTVIEPGVPNVKRR